MEMEMQHTQKKRNEGGVVVCFSVESRGIWQLPSTLWHLPLPCVLGMLGCLHYWHTGQCGGEGGLVEQDCLWKHVRISTGFTAQPLKKVLSAQTTVPRKKRGPSSRLFFFNFLERPWEERESQNKDNRHNHQAKLSAWRRNSLATGVTLPGKNWHGVSWQGTSETELQWTAN